MRTLEVNYEPDGVHFEDVQARVTELAREQRAIARKLAMLGSPIRDTPGRGSVGRANARPSLMIWPTSVPLPRRPRRWRSHPVEVIVTPGEDIDSLRSFGGDIVLDRAGVGSVPRLPVRTASRTG
jgi:hypothetical protein